MTGDGSIFSSLADWRRTVTELYAGIRAEEDPRLAWWLFVDGRDRLFKEHSQTPLTAAQRNTFKGLNYYDYDINLRLNGRLAFEVDPQVFEVELVGDGLLRYCRAATVHFRLQEKPQRLSLYWIMGYGGGLFLPFKDATAGAETYGGGRYLYDTIKGVDLGVYWDTIVLDFNFAYNPSCAYSEGWSCPLPPAENWLSIAIRAGEKQYKGATFHSQDLWRIRK